MTMGPNNKFTDSKDDHPESDNNRIPPPTLHGDHPQPDLNLSLRLSPPSPPPPPPPPLRQFPPQQPPNHFLPIYYPPAEAAGPVPVPRRNRRNPTEEDEYPAIPPPFPWATDRRAKVYSLRYLLDRGIKTISGDVQCKRCEQQYQIEYDLQDKFFEVGSYMAENKHDMRHRAPARWTNPTLPRCRFCHQENSVKPKIADKKKAINWLFLLLGEMLGCCTLEQLKYFCKHTGIHRTAAKDRVVFLTYLGLCKQVDPTGPFNL